MYPDSQALRCTSEQTTEHLDWQDMRIISLTVFVVVFTNKMEEEVENIYS
jgi:hypothetical protein